MTGVHILKSYHELRLKSHCALQEVVTYIEAFATRYNFFFSLNCLIRVHDDVIVIGIKIMSSCSVVSHL